MCRMNMYWKLLTEMRQQQGKELDYGKGYVYAHDTKEKLARMECLPESLKGTRYYIPGEAGEEKKQAERLKEVQRFWEEGELPVDAG